MSRSAFLFPSAVGLLANLAFVACSQAGSTTIIVNSELSSIPASVTNATRGDLTFSGVPSFSDLTAVVPKGASCNNLDTMADVSISSSSPTAHFLLGQAYANFTFVVPTNSEWSPRATTTKWQTNKGAASEQSSLLLYRVPEPTSMSLLGIGMAGLFAFRRFFRRNTNVRS
jgi:PEP-CTERM motif